VNHLQENELLHAFLSLRVVYYREDGPPGQGGSKPLAALVGIRE